MTTLTLGKAKISSTNSQMSSLPQCPEVSGTENVGILVFYHINDTVGIFLTVRKAG
jgi:hypothetical protein